MTVKEFEKAESKRAAIKTTLDLLDDQLTLNLTQPLTEPEVDTYLEISSQAKLDVMDNYKELQINATKTIDLGPYSAEYKTMISRAIRLFSAYHGLKKKFPVTTAPATFPVASAPSIRLPTLELPKFGGNLQEWVSFRDMFMTAVHNSPMTNVEKLTQLKSLLTGEASRQIRSLILSDANYAIAWKALQDRYENNRELLFNILRRLFQQQPIAQNSAISLRALIDTTKECLRSLEVLSLPIHEWDAIILFLLFQKLDNPSRELWEQSLPDTDIPSIGRMYEFLEQRARALATGTSQSTRAKPQLPEQKKIHAHHVQSSTFKCRLNCEQAHPLFKCSAFRSLSPHQCLETLKKLTLCFNCLMDGHSSSSCSNSKSCKICNKGHHTMVHLSQDTPTSQPPAKEAKQGNSVINQHCQHNTEVQAALLATAAVKVVTQNNEDILCRAFLDGGSSVSFITESCARNLNLKLIPSNTQVTGLSSAPVGVAKYSTSIVIYPHFDSMVSFPVNCLVINKITSKIPTMNCDTSSWSHIQNIQLADPEFGRPAPIDILLGGDVFWTILENDKKQGEPGQPLAIKSSLGWLIAGLQQPSKIVTTFVTNAELDQNLQRFWENEALPERNTMTKEETECETHFQSTHVRDLNGRFVVGIPWKTPRPPLGTSRQHAVQRLLSLERRLVNPRAVSDIEKIKKLQQHWESYKEFMREYENLGHMTLVPPEEVSILRHPTYYIPHHFVLKESSTTTKLRVVFDASASTSNGRSLNETMMVGPQLQDTIMEIMLRFRTHPIAYTADLEKMYRQIQVKKDDVELQRILWRENPSHPIKEYRLNTVTYGTASAPYLAVKCLQQLARDERDRYPIAARVALKDFYVDDLLSGAQSPEAAIETVRQIINLCMSGGFQLRKWTTNSQEVLASIPEDMRETNSLIPLDHEDNNTIKTLGVFWNPSKDRYQFKVNLPPDMPGKYTKRTILSEISKIYDPLGWLAPSIIVCKIFMQALWKINADWDDVLPTSTQESWLVIKTSLQELEKLQIPRCVIPGIPYRLSLVGFSDASEKAYSAVVYICCEFVEGMKSSRLLTSKTRVAPVQPQTLPRLELNGAVLLSELIKTVRTSLKNHFYEVRAYTDSTIVLHWVTSPPTRWKTYVRNRVQLINDNAPEASWFHVKGERNPADCASRGISPFDLLNHPLWWEGNDEMFNPALISEVVLADDDRETLNKEAQPLKVHHIRKAEADLPPEWLTRFSSFHRLQRVIAWVIRYRENCRAKKTSQPRQSGSLTTHELKQSHIAIMRVLQAECFKVEMKALQLKKEFPSNSKLYSLRPFICNDGILRVGGRLKNAAIPFDRKYPILLPRMHHITSTIITDLHLRHLHAGATSVLSAVNQRYWVIRGRDAVRCSCSHMRKC